MARDVGRGLTLPGAGIAAKVAFRAAKGIGKAISKARVPKGGIDDLIKASQGRVKNVKKGDIYAPGGRKRAKELFRKFDAKGIGNRTILRELKGGRPTGSRAVIGELKDGTPLRIRFKSDGTTRIQVGKQKIIFE